MTWVTFTEPYIYTPSRDRRVSIAYKAGYKGNVPAECARKAVEAGKAKRVKTPTRHEAEGA